MQREKRRFLRVCFEQEIEFLCKKGFFKGKLLDISAGGIFVEDPEVFPEIEEPVTIFLTLEGSEPKIKISFQAKVVRKDEKGFGLKLESISKESLIHLKNILYYNAPSPEHIERDFLRLCSEIISPMSLLKHLIIFSLKSQIMPYLLERAFFYSPEKPFILASGKESPYYLDCRRVTLFGPAFSLIGKLFWEEIRYLSVLGVAGMSIGADPIVCSILSASEAEGYNIEGLLIRKEPKKYGTQRQIEGNFTPGMPIALVEDVVTTGGSLLKAISVCENEGLQIKGVYALIDREEEGAEKIREKGYPFKAFFTFSEILSAFHHNQSSA